MKHQASNTKSQTISKSQAPNINPASLKAPNSKHQAPNSIEAPNNKHYDLEDRTFIFAQNSRDFIRRLPRTLTNIEYAKQLARASSSPAANYIEANESLSKKDFVNRVKICRKESKESRLWLRLCEVGDDRELAAKQQQLIQEALELTKIFNAIIEKSA